MSDSLWPHGLQSARLLGPWDSPGKNTGVGSHSLLQGTKEKTIQIKKKEVLENCLYSRWHVFICWKSKELNKNSTIVNKFSYDTGYKINIHKSFAFLYIGDEQSENEMKKTILFSSIQKNKIYPRCH